MQWADMVGLKFRGTCWKMMQTVIFTAESYDQSHGFWMVHDRDGQPCRHDVSERAIGRALHQIFDEETKP